MKAALQPAPAVMMYRCRANLGPEDVAPLRNGEIHLWHGPLQPAPGEVAHLSRGLSPDELERAERFHFEKNRNEFMFTRGLLRQLLGFYLGNNPAALRFVYSPHGKPSLLDNNTLKFNLSHTDGMLVCAFARHREIGVDIERIRQDFKVEEIAERFFSMTERLALRELSALERYAAFFHCWTRKEAYIKARGEGLSHPLHQFDVSLAPGQAAALLATRPDPEEARRWALWDLAVSPHYAAALAAHTTSTE